MRNSCEIDVSIACTHMMLEAKNLGLESCWVLLFDREKTIKAFDLPDNIIPVTLLDIGYSGGNPPSPRHEDKRPLEQTYKIV